MRGYLEGEIHFVDFTVCHGFSRTGVLQYYSLLSSKRKGLELITSRLRLENMDLTLVYSKSLKVLTLECRLTS